MVCLAVWALRKPVGVPHLSVKGGIPLVERDASAHIPVRLMGGSFSGHRQAIRKATIARSGVRDPRRDAGIVYVLIFPCQVKRCDLRPTRTQR